MILRQLFDNETSAYTYVVADETTKTACIIDPVKNKMPRYIQILKELNVKLVLALDTHIHADHITGLGGLKMITGCKTMVGSLGDVSCASDSLQDGLVLTMGKLRIKVIYTPGHTADSYCFFINTETISYLFSGDTLLIRGTGRTDFQNGNPARLYESIHGKILKLPLDTILLPGHDYKGWTTSTLDEEKKHNPRLQFNKKSFIEFMNNLKLPDPKIMDVAVPLNLSCGGKNIN